MDYSRLKPLNGIIVLKIEVRNQTDGGIFLIEAERLDYATVVAVGPGEWRKEKKDKPAVFHKVGVNVGDHVIVGPGSGVILETELDGEIESLTYMSERDIVAIIRNKS